MKLPPQAYPPLTITRVMKAFDYVGGTTSIKFPTLLTPKFDGIRAITYLTVKGSVHALSASFKPIRNDHIRTLMETQLPAGLDGELIALGEQGEILNFQACTSAVMSKDGEPRFAFFVFDYLTEDQSISYERRMKRLKRLKLPYFCRKVLPVVANNPQEFEAFEEKCVIERYEGVMGRSPESPYKFGRATAKEGYLYKVKRFVDEEAEVVDSEEQYHNANEIVEDTFGQKKRSSHKANKQAKGILGKLICKRIKDGVLFKVGTGFTEAQRIALWKDRHKLPGKLIKFKHQPHGSKDKPRIPVFLGFRHKEDMTDL